MNRIPVASTDITQVGYDQDSEILEIQFSSHSVYQYFNVPSKVYETLMTAPSKEEYYHTHIGERFPYVRLE
jgi:hypothetical protein